jgi:hypothetical protein
MTIYDLRHVVHDDVVRENLGSEATGVYKFECDEVYIGQTGRSFVTRFKDHMAHIKNGQPDKSNIALHSLVSKHNVKMETSRYYTKK